MAWMRQNPTAERGAGGSTTDDPPMDVERGDRKTGGQPVARIGKTVQINGELRSDEDLIIDGRVEGKVFVKKNRLTVGPTGKVRAEVRARWMFLSGEVNGDITAGDRLEITATGRIHGDIRAPRLVIADGATLKGSIDTDPLGAKKSGGEPSRRTGEPDRAAAVQASPPARRQV